MKRLTPGERALLVAYSIVEYGVVLDHMRALARVGVMVPTVTMGAIETERLGLLGRWIFMSQRMPGVQSLNEESTPEQVIDHARGFLMSNERELSELLSEIGEVR